MRGVAKSATELGAGGPRVLPRADLAHVRWGARNYEAGAEMGPFVLESCAGAHSVGRKTLETRLAS